MRFEIVMFEAKETCNNKLANMVLNNMRTLFIKTMSLTSVCMILMLLAIPAFLSTPAFAEISKVNAEAAANRIEYCSNDVPKDILDEQTITSTVIVTEVGDIADLDVKINIDHMWISDLSVSLIGPDGTYVQLLSSVGHGQGVFDDTILDDEAFISISSGSSPFDGSYKPKGHLSDFDNKTMTGTWTLQVWDSAAPDTGTLNSWCLTIEKKAYEPLAAPLIHAERSNPGGIFNTITWDRPYQTKEYPSKDGGGIPHYGNKNFTIDINEVGIIQDLNVKLNLTHGYNSELMIYLVAPDNTRIDLVTHIGGSSQNFLNTILDGEALLPISEGTGPFTGSFRPQGNLDELIGKNIRGTWSLEITDDGLESAGRVDSWSLIVELTDSLYFVQCADSANFSNIIRESGWITDDYYIFTELASQQVYWYRVKARPLMRWYQTTRPEFEADILTDTITTEECNIELPVADSFGGDTKEVQVIAAPSFESGGNWSIMTNAPVNAGSFSRENAWASDGNWSIGVIFEHDTLSFYDDYIRVHEMVDWTNVDTLMFDYACYGYADITLISVEIGNYTVWYEYGVENLDDIQAFYDEIADVSSLSGPMELSLKVKSDFFGWFDAYVFFDNLRTYRNIPEEIAPGNIISTPISINSDQDWDVLNYNATIPGGTTLKVDVLPNNGTTPIPGYSNVPNGIDLSDISLRTIRLRANLTTNQRHITPVLHDWQVDYTNYALESRWSNVVSSQ